MKNILAENMLRFGVKNLNESDKTYIDTLSILTEAVVARKLTDIEKAIITKVKQAPDFDGYGTISSFLNTNGVYFQFSQEVAADYILLGYIRKFFGQKLLKKYANKDRKFERDALEVTNTIMQTISDNIGQGEFEANVYQMNQHPEKQDEILTVGRIDANGIDKSVGRYDSSTNLEVMCRFINTYNLVNNQVINPKSSGREFVSPGVYDSIPGDSGALYIMDSGGEAGIFVTSEDVKDVWFWGLKGVTPAKSKTKGAMVTPPPLVVVGDLSQADIDVNYDVFLYDLDEKAKTEIKAVIDTAKSIGSIIELNVIGQASTETVNLGNSTETGEGPASKLLARWRGANQPGANDIMLSDLPPNDKINGKGQVGDVTDAKASGNAAIATQRAKAAWSYIRSLGLKPTSTTAKIVSGAAEARKIIIQLKVQKPDEKKPLDPQLFVDTVSQAGQSTEFAPMFQCTVTDVDLY